MSQPNGNPLGFFSFINNLFVPGKQGQQQQIGANVVPDLTPPAWGSKPIVNKYVQQTNLQPAYGQQVNAVYPNLKHQYLQQQQQQQQQYQNGLTQYIPKNVGNVVQTYVPQNEVDYSKLVYEAANNLVFEKVEHEEASYLPQRNSIHVTSNGARYIPSSLVRKMDNAIGFSCYRLDHAYKNHKDFDKEKDRDEKNWSKKKRDFKFLDKGGKNANYACDLKLKKKKCDSKFDSCFDSEFSSITGFSDLSDKKYKDKKHKKVHKNADDSSISSIKSSSNTDRGCSTNSSDCNISGASSSFEDESKIEQFATEKITPSIFGSDTENDDMDISSIDIEEIGRKAGDLVRLANESNRGRRISLHNVHREAKRY